MTITSFIPIAWLASWLRKPRRGMRWGAMRASCALLTLFATLSLSLSGCAGLFGQQSTSASQTIYFFTETTPQAPTVSVIALDSATGRLLWRHATGGAPAVSTADGRTQQPFAVGGVVYAPIYRDTPTVYHQNVLQALNASTGALLWEHTVVGSIQSDPVVDGKLVFLTSTGTQQDGRGYIEALRTSDGSVVWDNRVGSDPSPVAVANGLVILSGGDEIYALQEQTGAFAWGANGPQIETASGNSLYTPTVAGNMMYIEADNGDISEASRFLLLAFDLKTGAQVWSSPIAASASVPLIDGSTLIFTITTLANQLNSSTVEGLNGANGSTVWSYTTPADFVLSQPVLAHGVLYLTQAGVSSDADIANGSVIALEATTGAVLWRTKVGALAIGDGSLPPLVGDAVLCAFLSQPSSSAGEDVALNSHGGSIRWEKPLTTIIPDSLIIHNMSYALIGTNQYPAGEVFAVNLSDGSTLWRSHT